MSLRSRRREADGSPRSRADGVTGVQFRADLDIRTPLAILERHGELVTLDSDMPSDLDTRFGAWLPVADWDRAAKRQADWANGGDAWLVFLKVFRGIVEGETTYQEKTAAIERLIEEAELDAVSVQLVSADRIAPLLIE